mgnify:FL=1
MTRCAHLKDSPKLCVPQASPFATTFASLPEHWRFMRTVETSQFGPNLIAGGEFESAETLSEDGWTQILDTNHELGLNATLSAQDPHRGERALHLQVKPRDDQTLPAALDPMLAALVSRPIPVKEGDLLRIRFWLRVPAPIQGSIEGATVFDSIGGTRLAIWQSEPLEWKQYTLYRRVTHLDQFTLSIGLTGIGDVYLDDLVIQRAVPSAPITQQSKASPTRR